MSFLLIFLAVLFLLSTLLGVVVLFSYLMDTGHDVAAMVMGLVVISFVLSTLIWLASRTSDEQPRRPQQVEAQ